MPSGPVTFDVSSEKDSPVFKVTIEEEFASIPVGSSSVPNKKRGVQQPTSPVQKKRQTRY